LWSYYSTITSQTSLFLEANHLASFSFERNIIMMNHQLDVIIGVEGHEQGFDS
jgi:hypothetical protein